MISRVADHCFWFGRYLERAESTARVLQVTSSLALDSELTQEQCWLPVIIVAGEEARFLTAHGEKAAADGEAVQRYLTWDEGMASLRHAVCAARENARSIREVVSLEAWEAVNELYLWITGKAGKEAYDSHRYGFYLHVRRAVQLSLGLLRSTMLHDTPLDFIWLGVMLERTGQTARVLDVHHHVLATVASRHQVVDTALWLALLRACSGFEPFMKRNPGRVTGEAVASFLLLEPSFPRSIRFCVHAANDCLSAIRPPGASSLPGGECVARLAELDEWVRQRGAADARAGSIHAVLTHIVDETAAVGNLVSRELFGLGAVPA
jgi:uncharacterized alpha-E superfamily protein